MKVVVGGATGFIGPALVGRLRARKDSVRVITRDPVTAVLELGQETEWVRPDADPKALVGGCEAVVNLAGEPVFARRWTAAHKARILSSRIEATGRLVRAIAALPPAERPKVLVSASGVGWYGPRGDQELLEDAPPGQDFLAEVCQAWERAALEAAPLGVRVVALRIGVVLGRGGGALSKMLPPFRAGIGGPIGSGRQYLSWIHLADMVSLMLHAIATPSLSGPLNGCGPNPVTNRAFSRTLGRVLRRPSLVPMPGFALRLLVGEAAAILTEGQRVLPVKAQASGFVFRFPDLEPALREILGPKQLVPAR